jgi:hypothetical protein
MAYELLGQLSQKQTDDTSEVVLATVPQGHDDTVLEIVMIHGANGVTNVELRSLVWGNGLGWYRLHTLQLDGATARNIIQALGVVQRRVEHQGIEAMERRLLPFPHDPRRDVATA